MAINRSNTTKRMSSVVISGKTVYLSGQVGTGERDVATQTEEVLSKIDALLEEAGSSRNHILQAVIWLADMSDFDQMNSVWDQWVPEGHAPARACGEVKLASPDLKVEITVIAKTIV